MVYGRSQSILWIIYDRYNEWLEIVIYPEEWAVRQDKLNRKAEYLVSWFKIEPYGGKLIEEQLSGLGARGP